MLLIQNVILLRRKHSKQGLIVGAKNKYIETDINRYDILYCKHLIIIQ